MTVSKSDINFAGRLVKVGNHLHPSRPQNDQEEGKPELSTKRGVTWENQLHPY